MTTATTASTAPTTCLMPERAGGMTVNLTDSAVARIKQLAQQEGKANLKLRVCINGGGCSGFQYGIALVDTVADDEVTFEKDGAVLVTDLTSLPFINGATVDFERTMVKSAFKIHNPNAASGCGCGKSFSV